MTVLSCKTPQGDQDVHPLLLAGGFPVSLLQPVEGILAFGQRADQHGAFQDIRD